MQSSFLAWKDFPLLFARLMDRYFSGSFVPFLSEGLSLRRSVVHAVLSVPLMQLLLGFTRAPFPILFFFVFLFVFFFLHPFREDAPADHEAHGNLTGSSEEDDPENSLNICPLRLCGFSTAFSGDTFPVWADLPLCAPLESMKLRSLCLEPDPSWLSVTELLPFVRNLPEHLI